MPLGKLIETCSIEVIKKIELMEKEGEDITNFGGKLIFPCFNHSNKKIRISEQEARVLFIQEIEKFNNPNLYYSVETPTKGKYNFTSTLNKSTSGSLDMCLLQSMQSKSGKTLDRILNIEFKAHNPKGFDNDFEKLFHEPSDGLFFHLLGSVGNSTLTSVLGKYQTAMNIKKHLFKDLGTKKVHFIIASMSPVFLLYTCLSLADLNTPDFFDIDYTTKAKKITFTNLYNWKQLY